MDGAVFDDSQSLADLILQSIELTLSYAQIFRGPIFWAIQKITFKGVIRSGKSQILIAIRGKLKHILAFFQKLRCLIFWVSSFFPFSLNLVCLFFKSKRWSSSNVIIHGNFERIQFFEGIPVYYSFICLQNSIFFLNGHPCGWLIYSGCQRFLMVTKLSFLILTVLWVK